MIFQSSVETSLKCPRIDDVYRTCSNRTSRGTLVIQEIVPVTGAMFLTWTTDSSARWSCVSVCGLPVLECGVRWVLFKRPCKRRGAVPKIVTDVPKN